MECMESIMKRGSDFFARYWQAIEWLTIVPLSSGLFWLGFTRTPRELNDIVQLTDSARRQLGQVNVGALVSHVIVLYVGLVFSVLLLAYLCQKNYTLREAKKELLTFFMMNMPLIAIGATYFSFEHSMLSSILTVFLVVLIILKFCVGKEEKVNDSTRLS